MEQNVTKYKSSSDPFGLLYAPRISKEIHERNIKRELQRAVIICNRYHEPITLHYENKLGKQRIEDVLVIAATERYAILKGGRSIPIPDILKVVT